MPNQVKSNRVVGDVRGKTCILTDDMIDTGGTIAGAVKPAPGRRQGRHHRGHHGVLSEPASSAWPSATAAEVIVTNTLPIGDDKRFDRLTVLSIAPLLASTIRACSTTVR